jgi:hypothetical protein
MWFALCTMVGCVGQDDGSSEVASEASAIELTPVVTTREPAMPPVQSLRDAIEDRGPGGLIPDNCKAFQTIFRAGPTLGTFRAFGVCVRPSNQIIFQIVGDVGGIDATTGAASRSDLAALNSVLSFEAAKNSNEPDFTIGGGGLFPKGGPPQPGGTDPGVVLAVARRLQGTYDAAEDALKEATPIPTAGY